MARPIHSTSRGSSARGSRAGRLYFALVLGFSLVAGQASAYSEEFKRQEAMNPLQIIATAATPIGVAIDWLVVRPIFWLGQHQPMRFLFDVDAPETEPDF